MGERDGCGRDWWTPKTKVNRKHHGWGIEGSGEFAAVAACWFEEGEEIGHAQEAAERWVGVG